MENRRAILERVRATSLPTSDLPDLDRCWIHYDDPIQQFAAVLTSVGGQIVLANDLPQFESWLRSTELFQQAKKVASRIEGLSVGNVNLENVVDPHELSDLDLFVTMGDIAVAENAAVWVSDKNIPQRVALFIARHAVLVVPRSAVVHNMHEAYARLSFTEAGFGVFVSGPSKTADIEQSLVIGAHGPKSLHVVLVERLECSPDNQSGHENL